MDPFFNPIIVAKPHFLNKRKNYDFSSIIHDGYQSVSVQGYCLYDTFTGSLLFKLTNLNPNGNYIGSGMLPSDVTSIQIVPILPNGEKAGKDLTVTVEW